MREGADVQYGGRLRAALTRHRPIPFIGIYDVFSATLAARHFDALFASGFGFAASQYGMPDIGFIAWSDMVAFVQRLRAVLPDPHVLVDIDDGYGDVEVACHVVRLLESVGASGIVLEDQKRPRRCGHLDGKQLLELDEFRARLRRVLDARGDLVVVARTDATDPAEITARVEAFVEEGADAVLVDGMRDLELVRALAARVGRPFAFNQIAGGKSPARSLAELGAAGMSIVIYSTPCLFAAQGAIDESLRALKEEDGRLREPGPGVVGLTDCWTVLDDNLARRQASAGPDGARATRLRATVNRRR
jgi:2-methylisocitrate lyase-like PEP mutase family enzyme